MWLIAFAIFALCKVVTLFQIEVRNKPFQLQAIYLFAWPGLNPVRFLNCDRSPSPQGQEWFLAFLKCAFGAMILWWALPHFTGTDIYFRGWIGLVGLAFLLHFGLLHLLSCFWRALGFDAQPLMNWPVASVSLSEFWGHRWNTAFRDFTYRFLFKPLAPRIGPQGALLTGFAVSGIIHDLTISLPAGGGYGHPTAYFLLQSIGILCERSRIGARIGLARGVPGWGFMAVTVLAPAPLLFHPPFVTCVVTPFLSAIGAWQ